MGAGQLHDVAIIGAGPVGLLAAALLGRAGVAVAVIERYPDPFGLPRAIRMDHEAMRIWQELGIADELLVDALPVERYEWFGADGARSTVRGLLGIPLDDAAFGERWFVIDVLPRDADVAARSPGFRCSSASPSGRT
jgi:2-polyprenyl-6-methoxyphenol hydroxylase-like FAD-dependent oxidoreductase